MRCPYCGDEIEDGSDFCPVCGKRLDAAGQGAPEAAPTQAPGAAAASEDEITFGADTTGVEMEKKKTKNAPVVFLVIWKLIPLALVIALLVFVFVSTYSNSGFWNALFNTITFAIFFAIVRWIIKKSREQRRGR